jgi:hypothetical protein
VVVEDVPVENDLLFGSQCCRRQDPGAQFGSGRRRGAALPDDNGRGRVGSAHGGLEIGLHRQHGRDDSNDGVAGTRNVPYAYWIGRHVHRRPRPDKAHAGFAACHENRLRPEFLAQLVCRCRYLIIGVCRPACRVGKLLPVWRDHGRATIDSVITPFRIDHNRLSALVGRIDHRTNNAWRQRPLGIVRQDDRAHTRHRLDDMANERILASGIDRRRRFPIGAQKVSRMVLGDKADFPGRLPLALDHQVKFDQGMVAERLGQRAASLIVADRPDEYAARAQRHKIPRDVTGAADHQFGALYRNHRRRRFRRDSRYVTVDKFIQHQVADAENRLPAERRKMLVEIEH